MGAARRREGRAAERGLTAMEEKGGLVPVDDLYLFNTGKAQKAYLAFGCHHLPEKGCHRFCVWAPGAASVSVVGDFNGWDETSHPMQRGEGGVYTAFVQGAKNGDNYKYLVEGCDGVERYKADPFAFYSELRPGNASKVWSLKGYSWRDGTYLKKRRRRDPLRQPMAVYEAHLGSWRREEDGGFLNYREAADQLAPYLKSMGFTHLELMPITEYPLDESWGYQVTGYFSPTSRYGTPQDLMYLVDRMHQEGIGVILDWVPAHFPKDAHGLARFDGTCLYEHQNPLQGEQPQWGTLLYNYGRLEVQSFLISSANFFLEEYHIDGLRIDAVSSMLYLDFGKQPGQFVPNRDGGNVNYEAVAFLQALNRTLLSLHPDAVTIAEESTAFPRVTGSPEDGGLGFTFKWNMGFMHDTLDYVEMDPLFRRDHHGEMTFSMTYAFSENYLLPYSHDEVVHGKRSMIDKCFGDYWQKFATLRALYAFQYAHPGKKLLFMGDEFAQFIEWDYGKELDWFLHEYDSHSGMARFVSRLGRVYQKYRALYEIDDSWEGFQWLSVNDNQQSCLAFLRRSKPWRGKVQQVLCAFNFTPVVRSEYRLGMPCQGVLREILSSDDRRYGGSDVRNREEIHTMFIPCGDFAASAEITLPPLGAAYFEFIPDEENKDI